MNMLLLMIVLSSVCVLPQVFIIDQRSLIVSDIVLPVRIILVFNTHDWVLLLLVLKILHVLLLVLIGIEEFLRNNLLWSCALGGGAVCGLVTLVLGVLLVHY